MIDECLSVFRRKLEKEGENLILRDYIPANGTYVIVTKDGQIKTCIDIKFDKKLGKFDKDFAEFQDICYYDYHSKLISIDKPLIAAKGKVIQSNNYYTFWIKKESLFNGKLTKEIIEKYYEILEMPEKKYKKGNSLELYQFARERVGEVDKEVLNRNKKWILEHIFSLQEIMEIDLKKKDSLKIFFEAERSEYEKEGKRYFIPNIYNNNSYNIKVKNSVLGLPDNNQVMNNKKPFLSVKTRKVPSPYLLNMDEVMVQKQFFDYLVNFVNAGKYNVYVDLEHMEFQACRNAEYPMGSVCGFFLRVEQPKNSNEAAINYQDVIPDYENKLQKEFAYENVMEIYNDKYPEYDMAYHSYKKMSELEALVDDIFFSKMLRNNYFTEIDKLSSIEPKLKRNLITYRQQIFAWAYLGNQAGIVTAMDKLSLSAIKASILNEHLGKAVRQINLRLSLKKYFYQGGEYMADFSIELRENLKRKLNSEESQKIENDREYYYAVGQLFRYYIYLNKGAKKNEALINPILNAKNDDIIKKQVVQYYKKYNYAILYGSKRADALYKMVLGYEAEGSAMQDMICMGFVDNNLVLEKKEEKNNG